MLLDFSQKMTQQLILTNPTKTNNTDNHVFSPKITQAKEQNVASHLHTWSHCQPRRYWQSTANTASPVINECECVLHQACKRERSTESMTTTMHGLNREEEHHVTLRHNEMPWVNGSYFTCIMLLFCRDQRP